MSLYYSSLVGVLQTHICFCVFVTIKNSRPQAKSCLVVPMLSTHLIHFCYFCCWAINKQMNKRNEWMKCWCNISFLIYFKWFIQFVHLNNLGYIRKIFTGNSSSTSPYLSSGSHINSYFILAVWNTMALAHIYAFDQLWAETENTNTLMYVTSFTLPTFEQTLSWGNDLAFWLYLICWATTNQKLQPIKKYIQWNINQTSHRNQENLRLSISWVERITQNRVQSRPWQAALFSLPLSTSGCYLKPDFFQVHIGKIEHFVSICQKAIIQRYFNIANI